MRTTLLLTAIGTDRTGLVESLAQRISAAGANWEESRLARLAGQFAGFVLVTVDTERTAALTASLSELAASGLQVTTQPVTPPQTAPTGTRVRLHITGADRPGIVHDVSRILAEHDVNVDELESSIGSAPMSGEAMFEAHAVLVVPPTVSLPSLQSALEVLGNELMVDLGAEATSPAPSRP
jgi:glycine cleavage system regulatory protein